MRRCPVWLDGDSTFITLHSTIEYRRIQEPLHDCDVFTIQRRRRIDPQTPIDAVHGVVHGAGAGAGVGAGAGAGAGADMFRNVGQAAMWTSAQLDQIWAVSSQS